MDSGIRVHWGEEEKERGRLFCRIEHQIIDPVGIRPWASALFFKEKSTVVPSTGILGPQCKFQFPLITEKRGEDAYFLNGHGKLLLAMSLWKYFCGCRALMWPVLPLAFSLLFQVKHCCSIPMSDLLVSWGLVLLARKQHQQIAHFLNFMSH